MSELISESLFNHVHLEDIYLLKKAFQETIVNFKCKIRTHQYRFKLKNNSHIILESVLYALKNPFNDQLEYIVSQNKLCLAASANRQTVRYCHNHHTNNSQPQLQQQQLSPQKITTQKPNPVVISSTSPARISITPPSQSSTCSSSSNSSYSSQHHHQSQQQSQQPVHLSMPMTPSPEETLMSNEIADKQQNNYQKMDYNENKSNITNNNTNFSNNSFFAQQQQPISSPSTLYLPVTNSNNSSKPKNNNNNNNFIVPMLNDQISQSSQFNMKPSIHQQHQQQIQQQQQHQQLQQQQQQQQHAWVKLFTLNKVLL